jgi:predicted secreted hydrolase
MSKATPLLFVLVIATIVSCADDQPVIKGVAMSVTETLSSQDASGYLKADKVRTFQFPEDHADHPLYKNEWWYFTGNLETAEGRGFGYQFTLFRSVLSPDTPQSHSAWSGNQVYLAHIALSDLQEGKFYHEEQFSRAVLDIAGVDTSPFRLHIGQWLVEGIDVDSAGKFKLSMQVNAEEFALTLQLENTHLPVLHGEQGLSAKSPSPGNASYYYSYPALKSSGQVHLADQQYPVTGKSWYDHEWSTSSLEDDQSGWDWFSIQLSDGSELMVFQLRNKDQQAKNYYYGSYIDKMGKLETLGKDGISIEVISAWESPDTGVSYPSRWKIGIPGKELVLDVQPRMPNQEMNMSFRYWEGAISITGMSSGSRISGLGYAELTGYR